MATYKVIIEVTDEELDASQFGSIDDLWKVVQKVMDKATLQGYKGDR
jgi:hypothetical protein